jgi:hypothetical protein
LQDHAVCTLDLPIHTGVSYGGPVNLDVVVIAELEELLPRELCAVVSDDGVWHSETVDNVGEELNGLFGSNCGNRPSFYPL